MAKQVVAKIEQYISEARVFDLSYVLDSITKENLTNLAIRKGDFVIFKTIENEFIEKRWDESSFFYFYLTFLFNNLIVEMK